MNSCCAKCATSTLGSVSLIKLAAQSFGNRSSVLRQARAPALSACPTQVQKQEPQPTAEL